LDESQNTHKETQPSEKDALPLGEAAFLQEPDPPLLAIPQPAIAQQNITAQPAGQKKPETVEEELGEFERLTLRWSRINVIVLAATLIAIVGTGIVFWDQFQEMAAQSNLLGISARQARRDSAESAIKTQKQLSIAELQAKAAQDSVNAIQSQMRQDQRPLIKVDATFEMGKIARVGDPVHGTVSTQNVGKTPAMNMVGKWILKLVPNVDKPIEFSYKPNTWWGASTGSVFPNDPPFSEKAYWVENGWNGNGFPTERKISVSDMQDLLGGKAFYVLYGKITYTDEFEVHHWTKFCVWTPFGAAPAYFAKGCTAYNEIDHNR
jgi:hypothetical protein